MNFFAPPERIVSMSLTEVRKSHAHPWKLITPKRITKKKTKLPYHSEHVIPMQFWKQPEPEGVEGGNMCQLLAQRSHRLHSDQDIRTDRLVSYINAESQTIAWTYGSIKVTVTMSDYMHQHCP